MNHVRLTLSAYRFHRWLHSFGWMTIGQDKCNSEVLLCHGLFSFVLCILADGLVLHT